MQSDGVFKTKSVETQLNNRRGTAIVELEIHLFLQVLEITESEFFSNKENYKEMFELDNKKYTRVTKIGDSKITDKLSEGQMISHNSPYHKN